MSFNSIGQKVVGLVVSFLGAGSGATAWLVYLHEDEVAVSVPFGQDDFDSPVYLAFTLRRDAMLTVAATASSLVHNPHYGAEGWRLGAGVSLEISVDSEPCGGLQIKKVDAPIKDGRAQLQIDASCGPKNLVLANTLFA